jgi:hypothetical protein
MKIELYLINKAKTLINSNSSLAWSKQYLSHDQDQCIDDRNGLNRIEKSIRWNEFKISVCYLLLAYYPMLSFIGFGIRLISIIVIFLLVFTSLSSFLCQN